MDSKIAPAFLPEVVSQPGNRKPVGAVRHTPRHHRSRPQADLWPARSATSTSRPGHMTASTEPIKPTANPAILGYY